VIRLDGARLAKEIREALKPQAEAFARRRGRLAGLGVVLAGTREESEIYVRHKLKAVTEAGCRAELFRLGADASLDDALALVARLNADHSIDGILVQSPLPSGMGKGAEQVVFDAIDPAKDVDGFHPINVGKLVQKRPSLVACTPLGCIEILERSGIPIAGRHAVVIGRSDIVGKPMSLLLLHRDATVTMCHSRTPDVAEMSARADIVVAAVGRPGFVTRAFVKPGAAVVDVGINRITDRTEVERLYRPDSPRWTQFAAKGSLVVGDVHPEVEEVAGALTPVPGGVGPMTIAMVLRNTLRAAEARTQQ
jgi:methylenetetrahydrofolate dehydrogenase (NADP+) / methenyltetrahydrofolate cyclohydrolase